MRPYFEDEPIAGFWLGGHAVIVTRGSKLGVVVVER